MCLTCFQPKSSPTPNLSIPSPGPTVIPDAIEKGLISVHDATRLLHSFRRDVTNFPFVVIPDIDIVRFRTQRPALLLAILIAASHSNYSLQTRLDDHFRTKLSQKVMVEGTRSLDLVQGLIIYIAWYAKHHRSPGMSSLIFLKVLSSIYYARQATIHACSDGCDDGFGPRSGKIGADGKRNRSNDRIEEDHGCRVLLFLMVSDLLLQRLTSEDVS